MTPTEQNDMKELRKLAEAATPGPWIAGSPIPGLVRFLVADCGPIGKVYPADQKPSHGTTSMDDAKFIAAANPAAILALLDERDEWRERALRAEAGRDEWRERALRAEAAAGMSAPPVKS